MTLEEFEKSLHKTSKVLSKGTATVLGKRVPAIEVNNRIYNQVLIWGMFSVNRGKFKGALANNANTEEVEYERDI